MALSTTGMLMLRTTTVHVIPSSWSTTTKQYQPLLIECSSRPQKKATAHHRKTRPKKTQPWDVKRKGPTVYAPLPPLPPDWTLISSGADEEETTQVEAEVEMEVAAAP